MRPSWETRGRAVASGQARTGSVVQHRGAQGSSTAHWSKVTDDRFGVNQSRVPRLGVLPVSILVEERRIPAGTFTPEVHKDCTGLQVILCVTARQGKHICCRKLGVLVLARQNRMG